MKTILFITALLVAGFMVDAQGDSWKIKLNSKTLFIADKAQTINNLKNIKANEWKKSGNLEIIITEAYKNSWIRDIYITDDWGNELWRKDSTASVSISLSTIRKLLTRKKQLKIYSNISPANSRMVVRIRIVHLYTLKLP